MPNFSSDAMRRIRRIVKRVEHESYGGGGDTLSPLAAMLHTRPFYAPSGIPAKSGSVPGSAMCYEYSWDGSSYSAGSTAFKVLNKQAVAVPSSADVDAYVWAGEYWAAQWGGSSDAPSERCDCLDTPYEIDACGFCLDQFGTTRKMPRIWKLRILTSSANPAAIAPCYTSCSGLAGQLLQLKKNTGEEDDCTWENIGCIHAELSLSSTLATLTLTTREGCLIAVLTKPAGTFNCCGVNEGWTQVGTSSESCLVTVSLEPHECTCCTEYVCPPPDEITCPEVCCDSLCYLRAVFAVQCVLPPCTEREDPGCLDPPCPPICDPPCVLHAGSCVQADACVYGGAVTLRWIGGCRWYGRTDGDIGSREVWWEKQGDGTWKLTVTALVHGTFGDFYCTHTWTAETWDCIHAPTLTFAGGTTCAGSETHTATLEPL